MKNRIRFLEERKARWKSRAKALEEEVARSTATGRAASPPGQARKKTWAEPAVPEAPGGAALALVPVHHQYSVGCISLFLTVVLSVATSLRCASRVLALFGEFWAQPQVAPAWGTGRWGVLRVGSYKLTRPKAHAEDWGWIVAHTDQVGTHNCWLILGLRLSALPAPGQGLRPEDGEPLVREPVRKSTGEIV